MAENIIERIAGRLFRAVMRLPLGESGGKASAKPYTARIENPALRFRELQAAAEEHAYKLEARARFWSKISLYAGRLVMVAFVVSLISVLLMVREARYYYFQSVKKNNGSQLVDSPNKNSLVATSSFSLKNIRVPFKFSIPAAVIAGLVGYGGRRLHGRIRRRLMFICRKRDDFIGFVIRRRQIMHPLAADCDLLEQHLQRVDPSRVAMGDTAAADRTWRQSWLGRIFSNSTFWMKPAYLGRVRLW